MTGGQVIRMVPVRVLGQLEGHGRPWPGGQGGEARDVVQPRREIGQREGAPGLVNVPEHMVSRLPLMEDASEIFAADAPAEEDPISGAVGRSVGDQHVDVLGDCLPVSVDVLAPFPIEGHIADSGRGRRSPEPYAIVVNAGVAEVGHIVLFRELRHRGGLPFAETIVISRHEHPYRGRRRAEPGEKGHDLGLGSALGEVARVNDHVSARQRDAPVAHVGIG